MEGLARGIRFIHTAISREVADLERLASEGDTPRVAARLPFFRKVLDLHNMGEERGLFPEIASRARDVVEPYFVDHQAEKELMAAVERALATGGAPLVRALVAVGEHLRLHIRKEEQLLVPLVERFFKPEEQAAQVGRMMAVFTPADLAEVLPWLITWLDPADRRAYLSLMERGVPPERFAAVLDLIRARVSPEVWASAGR